MNYDDKSPLLERRKQLKSQHALELLRSKPLGVIGEGTTLSHERLVKKAEIRGVIFPWTPSYKIWWYITSIGACLTVFLGPFQIAFQNQPGTFKSITDYFELFLTSIFTVDIFVNFNLAYFEQGIIVFARNDICRHYLKKFFWIDFIGIFPFEHLVLLVTHRTGRDDSVSLYLSLLRILRFVRLHRMKKLSNTLQYDARISLLWFTMMRNFAVVLVITHVEACTMYFLARLHNFDKNTWLGPYVQVTSGFDRYVRSLYLSIVTFCTVGYGDFSPANSIEQIWGCIFMLVNVVVAAWIIGSITLLIVKGDEKTGEYRDSLQTLQKYGEMNHFEPSFLKKLQSQLRLHFNNREISDEQVLKNFPSAVRRRILRKLYLKKLEKTSLMKGVRLQFVDAFLAACTVEIFSPGEEVVERGAIGSDLFLLVGGLAAITTIQESTISSERAREYNSIGKKDNKLKIDARMTPSRKVQVGEFIGDIGFFTESAQPHSVVCLTVCKTLTMSQATYKMLSQDHPGSVGKILKNLLKTVESQKVHLPQSLSVLRAGSVYGNLDDQGCIEEGRLERAESEEIFAKADEIDFVGRNDASGKNVALTMVTEVVKMYMEKQLDDHTTKLLFAASRGDTSTITLMCDQGFSPNNADYDNRTGLMVAAMKGNADVVRLLLRFEADPNLIDMHGSTALLEAVKNSNDEVMRILLESGANLCMSTNMAASVLCQTVSDGDIALLKRLLIAGIDVNAADYDKRTATHVAAAERNILAFQILVQNGADLSLRDRWNQTASL